jgi:dTDP-4-dehydrorhamnose reductase
MRVLLTGASGLLGGYVMRELKSRGLEVVGWPGPQIRLGSTLYCTAGDLGDPQWVSAAFREVKPELLIHAGALASVEACRRDPEKARLVNTVATGQLVDLAGAARARMLQVSTDLVFDGEAGNYRECDTPSPLSVYGHTKRDAEVIVLMHPRHVVLRLSLLFGPTLTNRVAFFDQQLAALRAGSPLTFFDDEWRTPLSLATAARTLVTIALSDFRGLIHVGGPERMSRLEMGKRLAAYLGVDSSSIKGVPRNAPTNPGGGGIFSWVFFGRRTVSRSSVPAAEPRPRDTSLDSSLWRSLFPNEPWPGFEDALRELIPR